METKKINCRNCILYVLSILIFTSFRIDGDSGKINEVQRKQIIANTSNFAASAITFSKINIRTAVTKYKESAELYLALHNQPMYDKEYEYILAHFVASDNSIGIISFRKINECDSQTENYFLSIIDKNGIVSEPILIRCVDNSITIYEINFKFISDSVIQIAVKTSSEWVVGIENKADTLFTTKYDINFLKKPLDTIEKKEFQKILPLKSAGK